MPIGNITQSVSVIPAPPHRGVDVQTVFVTKQEDFQDHLQGTTITELNTLKDQLNSRIGEINSTATTMNGYANTASAGASTATTKAGEASTSASDALAYKNQAETFKNNASASATKASQWADNNYNVAVETGKYSAKHWSTVAQNATANKVDKVTSTDNAIVRFDGVTGQVQNSTIIIDDAGNMGINNNAPLGKLHVGGSIIAGDTTYANIGTFIGAILNNNSTTPSLDIRRWQGGGTNHAVIKIAGNSLGEMIFYRDVKSTNTEATTEKMKIDASGNLLLMSGTGGLGYGVGSGGTVTQLTSKSTAVTLNKPTGQIIMNNASLAAGASVTFILNNMLLAFHDRLVANGTWGDVNPQSYRIECAGVWGGVAAIRVTNLMAGSLSEAIEIEFSIIKGAIA